MKQFLIASAAALALAACTGSDVDDTADIDTIETDAERTEVLSDEAYGTEYDSELENDLDAMGNEMEESFNELGQDIETGAENTMDATDDAIDNAGDELEQMGDEIEADLDEMDDDEPL